MSEHTFRPIERHCDVAVVGGSAAGLAAALQLSRQRRSVIVVDAGEPRNAPAAHMHGYLGHEGISPKALTDIGRAEVRSYGGEVLDGRVVDVVRLNDDRFRVELIGGHAIVARRLVAATGLVDEFPEVEGFAQHWGTGIIHCPFCHGYEVRDAQVVLVVVHPLALHPAPLFRQLTSRLTLVIDGVDADNPQLQSLIAAGVNVVYGQVTRIVAGKDGSVAGVQLADGAIVDAESIVMGCGFHARVEPFASLGLHAVPHMSGFGDLVEVDMAGLTSVPGLYAAGSLTDPSHQVLSAAAHGSRVGAMVSFSLAHDDVAAAARPSANQADWDQRYSGEQIWSGNPNGALVHEVSGMTSGRALDVGAGEGGDAIWLAQQGWTVTASDVSQRGLDRVGAEVQRRGLAVTCLHADANAFEPYEASAFDLVSLHYASMPRTADQRGIRNVLNAVAVGGTLLVVSHDIAPMRTPVDTHVHSRVFDPDAFLRVEDFVAALAGDADWEIEMHEKRSRPHGSATSAHHVDDLILRARRLR